MKTSRFIGYSLPGYILCRLLRYQSCHNRLSCLCTYIRNGELCSVYAVWVLWAVREKNIMPCFAVMYKAVFPWELFRKKGQDYWIFVPNNI